MGEIMPKFLQCVSMAPAAIGSYVDGMGDAFDGSLLQRVIGKERERASTILELLAYMSIEMHQTEKRGPSKSALLTGTPVLLSFIY